MIPANTNRFGWSLFHKELGLFFSGDKLRLGNGGESGVFPPTIGGRNRQAVNNYGNQQKFRNFEILGDKLGNNMILGDSTKNSFNGRPTRAFIFKLTVENMALRVFKYEDGKRKCFRLKLNEVIKYGPLNVETRVPIPTIFNRIVSARLDKAHTLAPEDPKGKGPLVQSSTQPVAQPLVQPVAQPLYVLGSQVLKPRENQLGENESWGLPPLERQVGESSSSDGTMPMRVFGDLETRKDLASRCSSTAFNLDSVKVVFSVVTGSDAEVTHGIGN